MYLSDEVLNIDSGNGVAKVSEVNDAPGAGHVGRYLFGPVTLTSYIFTAP